MVMLGYDSTIPVTVDDMIHHGAAVVKRAKNAMIVVDMPFLSYHTSVYDAVANAGRIMKENRLYSSKIRRWKKRMSTDRSNRECTDPSMCPHWTDTTVI